MKMNGGFLVTKIKQLGDRIFEKILSEKTFDFATVSSFPFHSLWHKSAFSLLSIVIFSFTYSYLFTIPFLRMKKKTSYFIGNGV